MIWFLSYIDDSGKEQLVKFFTIESLFDWLQKWRSSKGSLPKAFCVYKGECVFDGS